MLFLRFAYSRKADTWESEKIKVQHKRGQSFRNYRFILGFCDFEIQFSASDTFLRPIDSDVIFKQFSIFKKLRNLTFLKGSFWKKKTIVQKVESFQRPPKLPFIPRNHKFVTFVIFSIEKQT